MASKTAVGCTVTVAQVAFTCRLPRLGRSPSRYYSEHHRAPKPLWRVAAGRRLGITPSEWLRGVSTRRQMQNPTSTPPGGDTRRPRKGSRRPAPAPPSPRSGPSARRAKHTLLAVLVTTVAALSTPALRLGQSAVSGDSTPAGEVQADVSAPPPPRASATPAATTTAAQSGQSLPVTGLDIALLAGVGLLLIGMGLALHRVGSDRPVQ